ncbi:MAG: flavin reductase family protein [Deltaproteobacteria bacterium]|nr:MAG: flavin reductase family protein [Deltaproteobacteria bacterium]
MKEISLNRAIELASPYPYALLVTIDKNEKPNIMGLSWWNFVSFNPILIIVSVAPERYSYKCLTHNKEFVLSIPAEDQAKGAWVCGIKSGAEVDKFKEAGFKPISSKKVKPPIIDGVTVAFECKVVKEIEVGDHNLFLGEVVAIHGNPDKSSHLYTIHYRKILSIDQEGNININP